LKSKSRKKKFKPKKERRSREETINRAKKRKGLFLPLKENERTRRN
jgi:hypothetical protein